MKTRAITGVFFIIVMLCSLFLGAQVFTAFYLVLSILCLMEYFKLVKLFEVKVHLIAYSIAFLFFCIFFGYHYLSARPDIFLWVIPLISVIPITELFRTESNPFNNIAFTLFGFIYVTVPFCFFFSLGFLGHSGIYDYRVPLAFLLLLWGNDTGAYLFGLKFGKVKLFERHSPKKTWEGFFGGVFTSCLISIIISTNFEGFSLVHWAFVACLVSCFGTLGDLLESMLKRSLNIKDSGDFLPGHGGLLDRFDGLLLSAPIVYIYLYYLR